MTFPDQARCALTALFCDGAALILTVVAAIFHAYEIREDQ